MDAIADYELVRSLGGGDRGNVYVAKPPSRLGLAVELVAVKVLRAQDPDDGRRRLTRELRLFASVQSPRLVPLYDAGQDGDRFFYATPYYARGSLAGAGPGPSPAGRAGAGGGAGR